MTDARPRIDWRVGRLRIHSTSRLDGRYEETCGSSALAWRTYPPVASPGRHRSKRSGVPQPMPPGMSHADPRVAVLIIDTDSSPGPWSAAAHNSALPNEPETYWLHFVSIRVSSPCPNGQTDPRLPGNAKPQLGPFFQTNPTWPRHQPFCRTNPVPDEFRPSDAELGLGVPRDVRSPARNAYESRSPKQTTRRDRNRSPETLDLRGVDAGMTDHTRQASARSAGVAAVPKNAGRCSRYCTVYVNCRSHRLQEQSLSIITGCR